MDRCTRCGVPKSESFESEEERSKYMIKVEVSLSCGKKIIKNIGV